MSSKISEFRDLCREVGVIYADELPLLEASGELDYKHAVSPSERHSKFRRAVSVAPAETRLDLAMSTLVTLSVLVRSDRFPRKERDKKYASNLAVRTLLVDLQKVKPVASRTAAQSDWIYI